MTTLEQAMRTIYDPTDTQYVPVSVLNDLDSWMLYFLPGDFLHSGIVLTSATDLDSAVAEAETHLTGDFGMAMVVDWQEYKGFRRRSVWSYVATP